MEVNVVANSWRGRVVVELPASLKGPQTSTETNGRSLATPEGVNRLGRVLRTALCANGEVTAVIPTVTAGSTARGRQELAWGSYLRPEILVTPRSSSVVSPVNVGFLLSRL